MSWLWADLCQTGEMVDWLPTKYVIANAHTTYKEKHGAMRGKNLCTLSPLFAITHNSAVIMRPYYDLWSRHQWSMLFPRF